MKKCKCGNHVAKNAKFCPQCGERFTHGMVKVLAWFFGVVIVIGIIGAIFGGASSGGYTPQPAPAAVSAVPVRTAATKPKPADLVAARKEYAKGIDQQLLDMGIESKTQTSGPHATTLVIEDALAGRVRKNAIEKNDTLFDNLKTLGFKRLKYTNNFDGDLYFGVEWEIQP